ncbi:MAG: polysaccharide biosynthesis/export family protein [Pseudomonadota bacterium]
MVPRFALETKSHALLAALLAAAALSACADGAAPPPPNFVTLDAAGVAERTYRLGAGDKLKVTVFGEENLSGQFEVNALGQVPLPLAGEVPAKGLTLNQFRDAVAGRLANGYLKNPKVSVEVLNFRPIYVHGEVKNGGEFAFKTGLKLRDAIAMAGGYTYRANQGYVLVSREGEQEVKVPMPSSSPVLPGDNVRIPERFF